MPASFSTLGWMAYLLHGHAFIKRHDHDARAVYPDFGCNVEAFTNDDMLELETLGPLVDLKPGASISHPETWSLHRAPRPSSPKDMARLLARLKLPVS